MRVSVSPYRWFAETVRQTVTTIRMRRRSKNSIHLPDQRHEAAAGHHEETEEEEDAGHQSGQIREGAGEDDYRESRTDDRLAFRHGGSFAGAVNQSVGTGSSRTAGNRSIAVPVSEPGQN